MQSNTGSPGRSHRHERATARVPTSEINPLSLATATDVVNDFPREIVGVGEEKRRWLHVPWHVRGETRERGSLDGVGAMRDVAPLRRGTFAILDAITRWGASMDDMRTVVAVEVTEEMLIAGLSALMDQVPFDADVSEISPWDLGPAYIAMRALESEPSPRGHEEIASDLSAPK